MATAAQISSFIKKLGALAVAESNRRIAAGEGFVLPSVCIAQSAIETGWGTAGIMVKANAFFGIKAGGSWTGAVYRADTWEVDAGGAYNTTANFRAYPSLAASVADYYDLIGHSSRYAAALSRGKDRSAWLTPKACITAIWAGGYATDTLYVEKIMSTINARDLQEYDQLVTGNGTAPIEDVAIPAAEFVQGSLIVTDSGRSIQNDRLDGTAIAIDWSKAVTIPADIRYIVSGLPADYQIYFATLNGDLAAISQPFENGAQVLPAEKVGFFIKRKDGSAITPADLGSNAVALVPVLPEGVARYNEALAHFVKVD